MALLDPYARDIPASASPIHAERSATPFARWEAAKARAREGVCDEAIEDLRDVLDEGFGLAGLTLGGMLREAGDECGAEAAYAAAARLSSSPSAIAAALLNQGLCCERREDLAAARECYRRAIAHDASAAATAQIMLEALAARAQRGSPAAA